MPDSDTPMRLDDLLDRQGSVTSSDLAIAAGISRQAAHQHLRRAVATGLLAVSGAARSTRYRRALPTLAFALAGLEEDRVWITLQDRVPALGRLTGNDRAIVAYAVSEMVNNAIDHSGGKQLTIAVHVAGEALRIDIADDGEGVFDHFCRLSGASDPLVALQEISKGRSTTDPARHTGEGLFFTSKAVDRFELAAGRLRWLVDNTRQDQAVLASTAPQRGTSVQLCLRLPAARTLAELFATYTDNFEFSRTRTVVKLFALGVDFVSRSEARRLLAGLERFREVIVDFAGVDGVGQGFADEVFRVWPSAHPAVRMTPVNMNEAVAFLVRRATPPVTTPS